MASVGQGDRPLLYSSGVPLRQAFLSALAPELQPSFAGLADLDAQLDALVRTASVEPGPQPDVMVAAVAARLTAEDANEPGPALTRLHVADLALALGCAGGDARALTRFDARYRDEIARAIKKSPGLRLSDDEFHQVVRERLFVASVGAAPRIISYAARAPLAAWLRVSVARLVIDLARRADDREVFAPDDAIFDRLPSSADPELAALRASFASVLPEAFAKALASLEPRQRNLLRQRYLHGLPASALATSYGVHRATVFGWIEDAREGLLARTREELRAIAPSSSLDSVIAAMGSELDLSVRRLLDSGLEEEPRARTATTRSAIS